MKICLGVREFSEDKIGQILERKQMELDSINQSDVPTLIKTKKMSMGGTVLQQELKKLRLFLNKQFLYSDRYVRNELHKFEVALLEYNEDNNLYEYDLKISI